MPIYAYSCTSCGHAQDVLQKISDAVLTVCPACGQSAYAKQLTAAGFQLKGSGWYVTDFRGGNTGATKPADGAEPAAGDKAGDKLADKSAEKSSDKGADKGADKTVAAAKPADKSASSPSPAPSTPATPASGG